MTSNKGMGPSLLCEWMVGTTIPAALGPPKSSKRDVIRVEVTTDDESDTDSIKITYPRSARAKKKKLAQKSEVKKVRFEAAPVPRKSALRKAETYIVTSASEPSDSEADSSDVSTDTSASEKPIQVQPIQVHAVQNHDSSASEASSDADSATDSDPHPTCKCTGCIRGRQKQVRRKRRAKYLLLDSSTDGTSESETDDSSEDDKEVKQKKAKVKAKAKSKAKETKSKKVKEVQDSESDSESESEPEPAKKHKQSNVEKNKDKKQDKKQDKKKDAKKDKKKSEDVPSEKPKKVPKKQKEGKAAKSDKAKKEKEKDASKKVWPEYNPGPDPRRPNLIEPIRAEVVQTERVIESPQDPTPNAYYDPQHNILRVYHGPVYGGQPNAGLYPKRDSSNRPLPIGSVHPSQNPYYWGFGGMSAAQGASMDPNLQPPGGPWNHDGMPPGYPPFAQSGPAQGGPSLQRSPPRTASAGSKGAFSDRAGRNNVVPGSVKSPTVNKYYSPQKTSPFATFNKPTTNVSPVPITWGVSVDGAPASTNHTTQQQVSPPQNNGNSSWNNQASPKPEWSGNDPPQDSSWISGDNGNGNGNSHDNSNTSGNWEQNHDSNVSGAWGNNDSNGGSSNANNNDGETPDWEATTDSPNANDSWGNGGDNVSPPVDGANGSWGVSSPNSQLSNGGSGSNVMPGEFPSWGANMATDTGGRVEWEGGEAPDDTAW